jgi:DNA-binding response OmpR family regulator/nitrogen-specific signal transduction histidine kinase
MIDFSAITVTAISMTGHWDTVAVIVIFILLLCTLLLILRKHIRKEKEIKENYDAFVSLSHDICTPLTLIKAPLSEIEMNVETSEECRKLVSDALRQTEKLEILIRQLLDFKKAENATGNLTWSECKLEEFIDAKLSEFKLAASQKCIHMELSVPDDQPTIVTDTDMLGKILDGLLTNAIKYTNSGEISVKVLFDKKRWHITVADTGVGIPEDEQPYIFHRQYRAKNVINLHVGGSGLGLMITKMIVNQLGGRIDFKSSEDYGTEFTVSFPYASAERLNAVRKDRLAKETSSYQTDTPDDESDDREQILLVEDNMDTLEYLARNLSDEYKVTKITNGSEALVLAQEMNPDIVISDIMIPGLAGDELCRTLKSSVATSHIPVILVTAMSAREAIIHGLEAGANDYILKPIDLDVLKARIKNILKLRNSFRKDIMNASTPENSSSDYANLMDKEFLNRAMNVLNVEMSNSQFSINDFCRRLGLSRTVLYNKIKTLTGQSPNDFIRAVRLNKAKELLESHKYMISEVADMVGFSDPKYFSVCYKKQFGISPSKV